MLWATAFGSSTHEYSGEDERLNIIFYARNTDTYEAIEPSVTGLIPKVQTERYGTVAELKERLRKPVFDSTVVVIMAADKDDLRGISALRDLVWGRRTILVLPDRDDDTIAIAHSLRPRFVGNYGDDFENVVAVLHKMIKDYNSRPGAE